MNQEAPAVAKRETYVGLFLVTLSTLMYEILLTRIFSVTMWYHFAFFAISVVMFGMTAGALLVYLFPHYFHQEQIRLHLAESALLFSAAIVITFLVHVSVPYYMRRSLLGVCSLVFTYVVILIPFIFSGICVCLALTRFPAQVSTLYAADLAGAAFGCVVLFYVLNITDGPTSVFVVASLASLGAAFFARDALKEGSPRAPLGVALGLGIFLIAFSAINTVFVHAQHPLVRLWWIKGGRERLPIYEKWNSFSRVAVYGNPERLQSPFFWGLSPSYSSEDKVRRLTLDIDAGAGTPLTAFGGDLREVGYLKYDVTNVAHYLRPDSKVFIIGPGGGRDILSSLVFGQKSVLGVEINKEILDTANRMFGDFTGHLDKNPRVTFVADEARSYIARQKEKFDIIQASLIDTFAATAAGAFVLTENSLYTVEAWKLFLDHLTRNGILTFSRWYFLDNPGQMYRLTSLAVAALEELHVKNPRDHIAIVRVVYAKGAQGEKVPTPDGVGTMLVSREPFTSKDLDTLEEIARAMQFDIVLSPRSFLDPTFEIIASGKNLDEFVAKFPINIAPPTDDNPFFFNMLRFRDIFNRERINQGNQTFNMTAIVILGILLITVIALTFLCIIIPLVLKLGTVRLEGSLPLFVFFASIGLGFMLIEISQMQRLIVFLGHPTYGLSVALFSLLLSSGLGSYLTDRASGLRMRDEAIARLVLLVSVLVALGIYTPCVVRIFQDSTTILRIIVAVAILFPLGMLMGMPFPLGMRLALAKSKDVAPWLWGINGAMSVCASVLAVVISVNSGISASFWTGLVCYAVALSAFVWASRSEAER